jgi:Domain of unknown function (DUF3786)
MQTEATVFERTYKDYLEQLRGLTFEALAPKLGAIMDGKALQIRLFNGTYKVSAEKIIGPSGEKPAHDVCVILSRYLLLCPDGSPRDNHWVSFRNFKDAGPLVNYFTNEVERAVASHFSGRINELKSAGNLLGGYLPALDVKYDLAAQFDALPMIPVIMLYNDEDEEFPAQCSILFQSRAEKYLDAECLAMIGWQLVYRLKKALK